MKHKIKINGFTGLTETQENACKLLAQGESVENTAKQLNIDVNTLTIWRRNKAFECYYNLQREQRRNATIANVYALADEAIKTLKESLSFSAGEATRLKAATYIIDKLQTLEIGETDVREAVRKEANIIESWGENITFDERKYKETLREMGVEEQDYNDTLR